MVVVAADVVVSGAEVVVSAVLVVVSAGAEEELLSEAPEFPLQAVRQIAALSRAIAENCFYIILHPFSLSFVLLTDPL